MKSQIIGLLLIASLVVVSVNATEKSHKSHMLKKKSQVALATEATGPELAIGTSITYFSCNSPANAQGWTYSPAYTTVRCAGTGFTYLGGYGAQGAVTSPTFSVAPHQGVVVSVKLAWIDSWDGESFTISANGLTVYSATHNFITQSPSNTCAGPWNDAYSTIAFGFNSTASTLTFGITSTLNQAASDESWGICDFTVTPSQYQVLPDGTQIIIRSEFVKSTPTVWFACSNPANDYAWRYAPAFTTVKCAGTGFTYLGGYGAQGTVTSPTLTVDPHNAILVSFKLAFMDSWDGEAFTVSADGILVYSASHNFLSQPGTNTCGYGWNDAYASVTFGFNHTANTVTFVITSTLNQAANDESWGICDFTLTASRFPLLADGTPVSTASLSLSKATTWFACANPVNDVMWDYSPSFSTIKCAGTGFTYLGPYGQGGKATSPKLIINAPHQGIVVSFKLAWIDSWDGEAFKISADGTIVYSATHNFQTQSTSNTCGAGWNDAYSAITFGFNHTASSVTFVITSTLDQAANDEAWGVCDFTVTPSKYQVLADGTQITTEALTDKPSVWFACSSPANDMLWNYSPSFSTIKCAGTGFTYLGPYGQGGIVTSPKLVFTVPHQGIVASFKLAWIDSWDGEAFKVSADGKLVYSATHSVLTQSFSNTCGNGWNDAYAAVTFGFNHTASTLTFDITSTLDQASSDESWGICDFTVTASNFLVNADGTLITTETLTDKPSVWFSCANPINNLLWKYYPSFSTIKCAGTGFTYLGPYGQGGDVKSPKLVFSYPHQGVVGSFKLAWIDSWDGEAFKVSADGKLVYSATHSVLTQSFSNTCGNGWNDAYATVTFGFNHTAGDVTFDITSTLDQASSDESWGICDFTVTPSAFQVLADGTKLTNVVLTDKPTVWFSCSNPSNDLLWKYSPAFSTVKCAGTGNTYLGPYGQGGLVTSPKLIFNLPHQSIIVSFKLAFMDSWDGEAFQILADGKLVYTQSRNFQSQPGTNSCGAGWNDAYATITFGFNHTADALVLDITSTLNQAASDESWGICDFTVTPSNFQVNADGTLITTQNLSNKPSVWFACSNPSNDILWKYSPSFSTIKCAGTGFTYLGPYGQGGAVTSPKLTINFPHQGVLVSFKLAWIDSWDGEAFKISADGTLVYSETHNFQTQSTLNTCGNGWNDAYSTITFGFNHTANTLTFDITSNLNQPAADEAWGICDFTVTASNFQVLADGTQIVNEVLTDKPTTWFSCSNPGNDLLWKYSPSFSTVKCAGTGNTYLGPYGQGGLVTSPKLVLSLPHQGIVVSFKLAFMDSWDGEAFRITADGKLVYTQSYNFLSQPGTNTCGSGWTDAYASVTFGFNHTASELTFDITSTLNQAASDESWGICDFTVTSSKYQVKADGTQLTNEILTFAPSTWFSCSNVANDILWTYSPSFSTVKCAGTGNTYLGGYGQGGVVTSPKLSTPLAHQGVLVSFKLAYIDSWDGEAFKVSADGKLVYSSTHEFISQSTSNTCGAGWNDAYANVKFGFNHTASTLTFDITSTLNQAASDESWGICDFTVTLSPYPLAADGTALTNGFVTPTPSNFFPCTAPANLNTWSYYPAYSTVKCAGTGYTYVGPYGQSGYVDSPVFQLASNIRGVIVSFKLAFMDSWDGESFTVTADNALVYSQSHNFQSQPGSNSCGSGWNDAYAAVTFGFNHTGSTLKLRFSSTLNQAASDESWGICDLSIKSTTNGVVASGAEIISGPSAIQLESSHSRNSENSVVSKSKRGHSKKALAPLHQLKSHHKVE